MMKAKLTLEDGTEFNVTVDESELKKETSKRWKPEKNEKFWLVDISGRINWYYYTEHDVDEWSYSQRNMFRTKKEANQHLAYLKARAAILDHADEVNEGWVPDWSSMSELKYSIYYFHKSHKSLRAYENVGMQGATIIHYKSEEAAQDAINKVGDEYLTVLGVEK